MEQDENLKPTERKTAGFMQGAVIGMLCGVVIMLCVTLGVYSNCKKDLNDVINYYQEKFQSDATIVGRIGSKMNDIEERINALYYEEIDWNAIEDSVLNAMVDALGDKYSVYYNKEEYKELMQGISGSFKGIGVLVTEDEMGALVIQTYEGGSARDAGILPDDIICGVNGEDMTGEDVNLITTRIKTCEEDVVTVKVYRPSEEQYYDFALELREVTIPTVEYEELEDHIGYIYINQFASVTGEQFETALKELMNQEVKGIIIDLRNNSGGNLVTTVEMLDLLLPEGMITYTKGKDGTGTEYKSDAEQLLQMPMVVLVNEYSASASEVFAGALKDYDIAKLVGTTTFGKGIVQSVMGLGDGTALKLTVSHYYTPSGVCIHGVGIEPDVVVELDVDAYQNEGVDNQLEEALNVMKEQLGK